jgi:bacterioferritin (cytochrome b1)
MANPKNLLLSELNALLRLTQTEATIANARRMQARSGRIAQELAENAENCNERALLLAEAIRDLGGAPDVVGTVAGRLSALAKTVVEQGQALSDALLGDLALEHQLLDRTRFARVLASEAGETDVIDVLDRLETAHTATIDLLMTRLSEIAVGGPSAIQPSPSQVLVGAGRRLAWSPTRTIATVVNRSINTLEQAQDRTEDAVETNLERVRELAAAAAEIWAAGRDATLGRTEEIARAGDDRSTARKVNRTRRAIGAVESDELPIRNYDDLNAEVAIARLERLTDVDDVRTVMAYESANKQRKGVMRAAEARFEELTAELIAAS